VDAYIAPARAQGLEPLAVPLHGRGLGEDLPVLNVASLDSPVMQTAIQPGQVFVMGPRLGTPDGCKILAWGDTVAVTESGARRLGKRSSEPIVAALGS